MQRPYQLRTKGGRLLLAAAFLAVLAGVSIAVEASGDMDTLIIHEQSLRSWIETHQLQAFLLGLGIYTAVSFIPGTSGKAIAIGWLFGFWQGVVLVEVGLTTAALLAFLFSRYVLRDLIQSRHAMFLARWDKRLLRRPFQYAISLRLAHVPYTLLNYLLGATAIRTQTFLWTTSLGLLPGTVVFVFAGVRLPTLAELAEQGAWGLLDPWLLAALGLSALAVPLTHVILGWWNCWTTTTARSLQESDSGDQSLSDREP